MSDQQGEHSPTWPLYQPPVRGTTQIVDPGYPSASSNLGDDPHDQGRARMSTRERLGLALYLFGSVVVTIGAWAIAWELGTAVLGLVLMWSGYLAGSE